ncbi:MAG: ribosome maturation factor RimP [Chlorobiaceae bacterium]|jgi:ribosome maturation factor RimP|nr:ribosome maturation factor RimP [Chlorobiaceae bacterium]NTW74714.1 ribosome maturation factor RimP [Chlorobiaceae bacterium]
MEEKIRKAIDEVMAEMSVVTGEEIWLVEAAVRGGGTKIELTVDTDRGIRIDQCAKLSRRIRERLESDTEFEPLAGGDFELLVSSPGLGEPIRVNRQYLRHTGRLLKVVYDDAEDERQEITGRLLQAEIDGDEPRIVLDPLVSAKKRKKAEVPPVTLRLADIVKASVQIEF